MRYTPPRPHRETFPPTRILRELRPAEETRATSPWWLTALRMTIAALLILAIARPAIDPAPPQLAGAGPLLLVVDNGWASAPGWERTSHVAGTLIAEADATGRQVSAVETARPAAAPPPGSAADARSQFAGIRPASHAPDRMGLLERLKALDPAQRPGEIVWLSDGLDHGDGEAFSDALHLAFPDARILRLEPEPGQLPRAIAGIAASGASIETSVMRAAGGPAATLTVEARDRKGRLVSSADAAFTSGERAAPVAFELPVELRNEVARVEIAGERHAGAVRLMDDRFRRRSVGLVSGASRENAQPLLDPLHYIAKALVTTADLRIPRGADTARQIDELIETRTNVIVLADIGTIAPQTLERLGEWVRSGGVLVRFAGPRLADATDELLPVRLRPGERSLGGVLSWGEPQGVGGTRAESPLGHAAIPRDVKVTRQILAEPAAGLAEKTWAWLEDGTPLVTGARDEQGYLVLFHVTADARWSNLPLTGLFTEMLQRIVGLGLTGGESAAAGDTETPALRPLRLLDANGVLVDAAGDATPLPPEAPARGDAEHPPGLYGNEDSWRALNALADDEALTALAAPRADGAALYPGERAIDLAPWAFLAALVLLAADTAAVLLLGGLRPLRRRMAAASLLLAAALLPPPASAQAPAADAFALQAVSQSRLAYVVTGNAAVDRVSEAGLRGLGEVLKRRTAFEPGPPIGIDPARDEMAFFALVYWPIDPSAPPVDPEAIRRIDAFMKQGGTVLFDTRDQLDAAYARGQGAGSRKLSGLLAGLDLPELEPVPLDHVLTKSFYLIQDFPGRYAGSPFWVERLSRDPERSDRPARGGDGVSPLLITGNDLAAAWAIDDAGQPLFAVTPGGERQREMSYRAGVNIVMYTLTGNYKADQVHIPALLERLGQ
ncbi:MAG: DUF4159 domain-containing protein [Flavobacteriaceae bacterium]